MNDNRNLLLAVVLSMLVLLGWSWASQRYFPAPKPPAKTATTTTKGTAGNDAAPVTPDASVPQNAGAPTAPTAARPQSLRAALAASPRVAIDTPTLKGSINLKGAQIDDLTLENHSARNEDDSPPIRLLSPIGTRNAQIATFGWVGAQGAVPTLDTVWQASSDRLTPAQPVILRTQLPNGMRYQIEVSVDDGTLFTVKQGVANDSGAAVTVQPSGLVSRSSKSLDASTWTNHVGPISVFDGKANYDVDWETLDTGESKTVANSHGWLGFTDKYWLTALAPKGKVKADFRAGRAGGYQADYVAAPVTLQPGQQAATETRLFAGAKDYTRLKAYQAGGIDQLSRAIDWGWFRWFMLPIFDLLLFLFRTFGNFGFAIMGLTLIVRLIMFPIAQKQFHSMAAMRKIQPKLKAIQERFKDDKQRQQQEILQLYQKEKINPAAGCLPILIQIPVFYALYKVLMVSVEMRHQPFILWIKDLSAPDPLTPVNLFGLLDFTPPHLLAIGVLPILVGFTQWLSMKLNPQPMDPMQQQIFSLMPWFLVFVMAPFAAGLQLYWLTNNLLTIIQQWWLYRRFGLHLSDTHPVEE